MLDTSRAHFNDDVSRARALLFHARSLQAGRLREDVLRATWMMAVGACDAYFSDAYADLIARTLRAKDLQPGVAIPDRLNRLRIPVVAVLRQSHGGWRWRMAARELIEDENVLSLEKIRKLFNHFFRGGYKLLNEDTIGAWITHRDAKMRLFGLTATQYRAKGIPAQATARRSALKKLEKRFEDAFQRRHDCIHNCDRPKVALQPITDAAVEKRIQDIEFLVGRCEEALRAEFPVYLQELGFAGAVRAQVV